MALELWIPKSAVEKRRKCVICGKRFPWDQQTQFQRHVIACDKKNPEVIEGIEAARQSSAFTDFYDKEAVAWVAKRKAEGKPVKGFIT